MAFGSISTLYIPTAALAGASQWGTNVVKLLDVADTGLDVTTTTSHGTGAAVTRTYSPYATMSTDATEADYGWAVTPSDMNSVSGARRFMAAGDHVLTCRMNSNSTLQTTGTMTMYVYRVASAASSRTRTLIASGSASVIFPAASGLVTATVTVTCPEIIFEADETIQYSFEMNITGQTSPARVTRMRVGTNTVASSIAIPTLKTLADATGTAAGSATATATTAKILGTDGSSSGATTVSGVTSSRADFTGSAAGMSEALGAPSSVSSFTGTSLGAATTSGQAAKIIGTTGTVEIGAAGGGETTIIKKPVYIFD